ncbi:hypothetical protein [Neisseria mucosa]|uniref:Uncharacterized protein n=2 Tax=Neisseria TaxID=482 RepID=A0ABN0CBY5_NEIMU|nr:hypothetical protein [Neisseria mucosa]EFV80835.1 hypothetical protein HMPREF0604_00813 [Neisseria mucosa C102]QKI22133.1 hypothetical protein FOC66_04465 [Neisseria mucosa]
MNQINPKLQTILDNFTQDSLPNGKNSIEYHNLLEAVTASPVLNERLNTAVEKGYLEKLSVNQDPNSRASYTSTTKEISINLQQLKTPEEQKSFIFVLGHEIQHGFYHYEQGRKETEKHVIDEVRQIAASDVKQKDYTHPLKLWLDTERKNEALAMIAGWNAVTSYEQKQQGKTNLSLQEIIKEGFGYEHFFLDEKQYYLYLNNDPQGKITPTAGLKFNADMTISDSQHEILAKTYFDRLPDQTHLGKHGDSDYRNSYATGPISYIVRQHYAHNPDAKLIIDMKGLGLDEYLIERNGLDLGKAKRREAYYDKTSPDTRQYFDHTINGENQFEHVPITNPKSETEEQNHPYSLKNMPEQAQKLHAQITDKFTEFIKKHHLPYSEDSIQNGIAALTAEAYAKKLPEIMAFNITKDNCLGVMHKDNAFLRIAKVDVNEAMNIDSRESFKDILKTEQNFQLEAEQREMEKQMNHSQSMGIVR